MTAIITDDKAISPAFFYDAHVLLYNMPLIEQKVFLTEEHSRIDEFASMASLHNAHVRLYDLSPIDQHIFLMKHHSHDDQFIKDALYGLPSLEQHKTLNQYEALYIDQGRRAANVFLLDLDRNEPDAAKRYVDYCHKFIDHEYDLSGFKRVVAFMKRKGLTMPKPLNIPLDTFSSCECASHVYAYQLARYKHKTNSLPALIKRLFSEDYWARLLAKQAKRKDEQIQRIKGNVSKDEQVYVSDDALADYEEQQEKQREWEENTVLIAEDGEEKHINSADSANRAQQRFAEYIIRGKGLEELAQQQPASYDLIMSLPNKYRRGRGGNYLDFSEFADQIESLVDLSCFSGAPLGYVGLALTIAPPSRFHAVRYDNRKKKFVANPKFDKDTTPIDSRNWLQETLKLAQTEWKRDTKYIDPIEGFGYRVTELHGDGTPHYHLAYWCNIQDVPRFLDTLFNKVLRGQFTDKKHLDKLLNGDYDKKEPHELERFYCKQGIQDDATQYGAKKYRLNFKIIESQGGMTAYMLKYISKGITGHDYEDLKSGLDSKDSLIRIMAGRSMWGLRQFSFVNASAVGVYRELRRLDADDLPKLENEQLNQLLKEAHKAAKLGDWAKFTRINGGAVCPARKRPIQLMKGLRTNEDSQPVYNQYGEAVYSPRGVFIEAENLVREAVETRQKSWHIVNLKTMKQLLSDAHKKLQSIPRYESVPELDSPLDEVIATAKARKRVGRLTDFVGLEMSFPVWDVPDQKGAALPL